MFHAFVMTQCFMRDCQLLDTHLEPTCAWKKVQLRAQPAADECEHGHALPTQDSETCFVFTSCKEAMAHGWMYATWNWQSRDMTCKPSEGYRKGQLTATSIMFPCSHHACICIAVLSSWTSGLRCKGNWHKNKKSFQQTCISMNEMITCCFSKKSAQSCNTCSLSVAMWEQWKCQFLQHHQTSEIPHMQITTFNTRSASNTCHLFKFIIANTSTQKRSIWFLKNNVCKWNCFVYDIKHLKITNNGFVFVITCQRHPARKKIQTISDIPVLFPPKFDKHTFDKQRLRKKYQTDILFLPFLQTTTKRNHTHVVKHGCTQNLSISSR